MARISTNWAVALVLVGATAWAGDDPAAAAETARQGAVERCALERATAAEVSTGTSRDCHTAVRDFDRAVKALRRADRAHAKLAGLEKSVGALQTQAKDLEARVKQVLKERADAEREQKNQDKASAAAEKKYRALLASLSSDDGRATRFCQEGAYDACHGVLRAMERRFEQVPDERAKDREIKALVASFEKNVATVERAYADAEAARESQAAQHRLLTEYQQVHKQLYDVLADLTAGKAGESKAIGGPWLERIDAAKQPLEQLIKDCPRFLTIAGTTFSRFEPPEACELAKNREQYRSRLVQASAAAYVSEQVKRWQSPVELLEREGRISTASYESLLDFAALERKVMDPLRDFYRRAGVKAPSAQLEALRPVGPAFQAALRAAVARKKWESGVVPVKTATVAEAAQRVTTPAGLALLGYGQKQDIWTVERHERTGVPLRRITHADLQTQKAGESHCRLYGVRLTSEYDGERYGTARPELSVTFHPITCVK